MEEIIGYDLKINELEKNLVKANEKIEQLEDKYLRLAAEYDNFRKRTIKEKEEIRQHGHSKTVEDFLNVIDDFERAINNIVNEDDKTGIKLIFDKFNNVLKNNGVEQIEITPKETSFDDEYHEAIMMTNTVEQGIIANIIQNGYKLNNKVIRHAKVVVGS